MTSNCKLRPAAAGTVRALFTAVLVTVLTASSMAAPRASGAQRGPNPHIPLLTLGDFVWHDDNDNGIVDPGEAPIDGVQVVLFRDDGDKVFDPATDTFVSSEITAGGGRYLFSPLPDGEYFVQIPASEFEAGLALFGLRNSTGQTTTDVNNVDHGAPSAVPAQGIVSHMVTLQAATEPIDDGDTDPNTNLTIDFGFVSTLRLGNLVWADVNDNGRVDPGEAGLAGLTVRLLSPDGATVLRQTTTDADGHYGFDALAPGAYRVEVVLPPGATSSHDIATSADPDNDVDDDDNGVLLVGGAARSGAVTLAPASEPTSEDGDASSNLTVDFGVVPAGVLSLGNLVWFDLDNDAHADPGEPGVTGVTVRLLNGAGTAVLASTTTDATGHYRFTALQPGTYRVEVERATGPVAGYLSSTDIATSADPDNDVDDDDNGVIVSATAVRSGPITLSIGGEPVNDGDADANSNLSVDFGFVRAVALGNLVWADFNDNGVVDAGEPGIPRATVRLIAANGTTVLATATTDATGHYLFGGLVPGAYYVEAVTPRDTTSSHDIATTATPDNDRDNDDNGIGAAGAVMRSGAVHLAFGTEPTNDGDTSADTNLTVDFGFVPLSDGGFLADVCLQQAFPATVIAGGQMTATYTAENRGPGPASNLVIDGMLPPGVSVTSTSPSAGGACTVGTDMVVCRWPGLTPAGVNRSVSIGFRVAPTVPVGTPIALWFMTSADTSDPYPACNMVDAYIFVTGGTTSADLVLSEVTSGGTVSGTSVAVPINQPVSMQFSVTNAGTVPASGRYALLLDEVGVLELTAAQFSQGSGGIGTATSGSWDTGAIAPGRSAVLTLQFTPRSGGAARVQLIRTEGTPSDPNATNDRAVVDVDAIGSGGGRFVAAGNVDGVAGGEILTGAGRGETPQIRVFSGAGTPRSTFYAFNRSFRGGVRVASCDVDGDGVDELIAAMGPGGGRVRVLSLVSGAVNEVAAFDAFESTFVGGVNVACSDLDGDGRAEVVVGPDGGRAPDVKVFSVGVLSATVTAQFQAYEPSFQGGVRVAAQRFTGSAVMGAFNVVTTPGPGRPLDLRAWQAGGQSGALIAGVRLSEATTGARAALGDVTGDGVLDLVTTPDAGSPALVRAYSLSNGAVVLDVPAGAAGYSSAIAATGRLAGGTGTELIVARGAGQVPVVSVVRVGTGGAVTARLSFMAAEVP